MICVYLLIQAQTISQKFLKVYEGNKKIASQLCNLLKIYDTKNRIDIE